jgi:hypothetical protein
VQPSQVRDEFGRFAPNTPAPAVDTTPNLFEGTAVNPDTLPPELQPLAKQLQAAFTQKTQALAQQRTQIESLGSLDELRRRRAVPQPPGSWVPPGVPRRTERALEAQGLTPGQARAEAARQIEGAPLRRVVSDALARLKDDPELAPLADALLAARVELDGSHSFEQAAAARAEAEQLAQAQMALAGEIQRQEMAIRQVNPHYTDADMDADLRAVRLPRRLSLLEAQQRYEQIVHARVERYIASKQAPSLPRAAPCRARHIGDSGSAERPAGGISRRARPSGRAGIDTLALTPVYPPGREW